VAVLTPQIGSADNNGQLSELEYRQLIERIKTVVRAVVPPEATVLVVSKGDNELLSLEGREGWHFPREPDGRYAGHHPADSAAAIAHLEELRKNGGEYLLFPSTSFWWLDYYKELADHLKNRYRMVFDHSDCRIVELGRGVREKAGGSGDYKLVAGPLRDLVQRLLPSAARIAVAIPPEGDSDILPGTDVWRLPDPDRQDQPSAIEEMTVLQSRGVEFLIIPRSAFDWLERHSDVQRHLSREHRFVTRQKSLGAIYELRPSQNDTAITPPESATERPQLRGIKRLISRLRRREA
jgi:hypothetical protein